MNFDCGRNAMLDDKLKGMEVGTLAGLSGTVLYAAVVGFLDAYRQQRGIVFDLESALEVAMGLGPYAVGAGILLGVGYDLYRQLRCECLRRE